MSELERRSIDAVMIDARMSGVSEDLCRRIRKKVPFIPILLVSRRDREQSWVAGGTKRIAIGGIELDPERRTVHKDGTLVSLAQREFELLHYLMKRRGKPVTYHTLIEAVWGAGCVKRREHLRRLVCVLRRKIEDDAAVPRYLLTESSFGYRFCEDVPLEGGRAGAIL